MLWLQGFSMVGIRSIDEMVLLMEQEELKRMYEANAFAALKVKDPNRCLQSVREDNNGRNQESSSDHKS